MMKFIRVIIFALFFISASCENDAEIVILCTNDMHGSIDNFAKLSAYYKKMKAENPNTFLFSDGDLFSGNPLVDQYPDRGYPIVDIMNKVGYCLSSLGNHEFDYGQDVLNRRIEQAEFPVICANIGFGENAALKHVEPYQIFDIDKITMAVLSLIEVGSEGIPSTHPKNVVELSFDSPQKTVEKYSSLRKNNVFILLSHLGIDRDVDIAEKYPEIDVILGGHSHTKISKEMIKNGVLITQAGDKLNYVGETRISIKQGKIVGKTNKLIDLNKLTDEDPEVKNLIADYKAADPGNKVIGQAVSKISGKQKLGALMTDALTEMLELDIAFQNTGGVRVKNIPKGDITKNMVYTLDPFGNDVVKLVMSYDELAKFILKHNAILLVSGITCTIDAKEKKKSIKILDKNGKELDKSKKYTVGMNSYIYSTCKFTHENEGVLMNVVTAEILIEFIENKKIIDYKNVQKRIIRN